MDFALVTKMKCVIFPRNIEGVYTFLANFKSRWTSLSNIATFFKIYYGSSFLGIITLHIEFSFMMGFFYVPLNALIF